MTDLLLTTVQIATSWLVAVGGTVLITTIFLVCCWMLFYAFFGCWKWWE